MKADRIKALLLAINSKPTGFRAGWVEGPCPMAPWNHLHGRDAHPSFGIKTEVGKKSICKCLSCGFGGDLMDLIFKLRDALRRHPVEGYKLTIAASLVSAEFDDMEFDPASLPEYGDPPPKVEFPFPETWLASFKLVTAFPVAMDYLSGRGVSPEMAKALDLRYDPLQRRIGFPFRNFKGELMGVQGRSLDKVTDLRYFQYGYQDHRNLHAWMGEDTVNLDKPVVMVEGPFDFTSVLRVYPNVVASFTSGLSVAKLKRLQDAESVITLYDFGSGGNAARKRIREFLKGMPVYHVIPSEEQDDAGAMSVAEVSALLKPLVALSPFGKVAGHL